MKGWDRYADYAIVGGLFWIGMFVTSVASIYFNVGSSDNLIKLIATVDALQATHLINLHDSIFDSIFSSMLSALGVIAVFCTGMLIDLVSPAFTAPFEIYYFKRFTLERECGFIEKVFKGDTTSSMFRDYELLATTPILFYKGNNFNQWFMQRRRYTKVLRLLITYCLQNSEAGVLEELKDRLVFWRTGRALGGSIVLVALTVNVLLMFSKNIDLRHQLAGIALLAVLWGISGVFVMGQYTRMCNTLKSIMYLIDDHSLSTK
ncbi:MAG: hypothetical protein WA632_00830 [Gallionella sp.]